MSSEILIDGNLYELHCKICDVILAILEKSENANSQLHDYVCDICAIAENQRRLDEIEAEREALGI